MNKEMITRRAFAGLAAGGAASTLAACNSDVMQAILNPDSILGGAGQDPQNGGQGGTGDTPSQSDFVKLEEIPDHPTLTGDFSKIITGVWCVDNGVGTKGGSKEGKTFDHGGMLNQGYNDGTVLYYSFKEDGTFFMHNFKGVKNDGKWEAKGTVAIQCNYDDGDSVPMLFDKDDNNYLKYSDAKSEITFNFKKLSDNPDDTSQIAYIEGQVINFAATIPGTYFLFGLHYADGSKEDLTSDQIESMNKGSGGAYTFSAHKDGAAALCSIQTVAFLLFRLLQKSLRQMVFLSPFLLRAFQKLNRYLSLFYTLLRKIKSFSVLMLLDLLLSLPSLITVRMIGLNMSIHQRQSSLGSQMVRVAIS